MRLLNYLSTAIVLFTLTACTSSPESDEATTTEAQEVSENTGKKTFTINPSTSKIEWIGTKVSGYHVGTVNLKNGEVHLAEGNITGGRFVMDMNSIAVTGPEGSSDKANQKLLGHLKSEDFFMVEHYPEVVFEITSVEPFNGETLNEEDDPRQAEISEYKVTNPTHKISGNLTIRDVTKNIEFPAKVTVNENSAEAIAKFNINRKDWDITYPGAPDDLIRDDIHLGISLQASQQTM